jgi:NhaP-type Na+/H+ or K+/H+ antiporter
MSALWLVGAAASGLSRLTQVDGAPEPSEIKPGWVALVIVLTLCVATALLWLNMRKQLRKINFEEKDAPPRRRGGERPAK